MAGATEVRRSPPFATEDEALELAVDCPSPLTTRGGVVDATKVNTGAAAQFQLRATIDWDLIRKETGIDGPFRVVVTCQCTGSRWSSTPIFEKRSCDVESPESISWTIDIPKDRVYGMANCEVLVLLAQDRAEELSGASRAGSILSRKSLAVRFDKGGFEFPTRWVPFSVHGYPEAALWTLHIRGDDWAGIPEDTVEVRLNSEQSEFQVLMEEPGATERHVSDVLRRLIVYESLAELVIQYLILSSVEDVSLEGDRLCDVVERMIDRNFSEPMDELRRAAREAPGTIRMRMQEIVGLGSSLT